MRYNFTYEKSDVMKKHIAGCSLTICCLLFMIMIIMGMNGKALSPKQAVFVYPKDTEISKDAHTYLKGVIRKDHIKLDLSKVDSHTPGVYPAYAKQSNRTYEFRIEIK